MKPFLKGLTNDFVYWLLVTLKQYSFNWTLKDLSFVYTLLLDPLFAVIDECLDLKSLNKKL